MKSLKIPPADVRGFMRRLLREEGFDAFCARSVELTVAVHITIDGKLEGETERKFITWEALRPMVCDFIAKGSKPRYIKIVFSHAAPADVHENAAALFLNFTYENDGAAFTTATAQREFALDKSLAAAWDEWVAQFFAKLGVATESERIEYE